MRLLPASLFGWCCLLLASCSQPDPYATVSAEEAIAFGKKWAYQLSIGNQYNAAAMFSRPAFARQMADYNFYGLSQSEIATQANNFDLKSIVKNIQLTVQQGGHYRFINHFSKGGRRYVRMRQYGSGALTYHDVLLVKENEEVKMADIYIYHSGQLLSAIYMQALRSFEKSGKSRQAQYFEQLRQQIADCEQAGDAAGLLEKYHRLPEQLQRQQQLNYLALMAAMSQGNLSLSEQLYSLYTANNHTRPDRYLIDIQYAILQRRHADALANIDSLGRLTGDDKWLVFYKAVASLYCGQLDAAGRYLQQSLKNNRDFGDNYLYLAHLLAMRERWPEARLMLERYRRHPDFSGTLESELVAAFPKLEEDE
jgi:hypothetical protein